MERRIINPWTWQDRFGYVQANEVSGVQRRLICAGQTSSDADGKPVFVEDMAGQINQAIDNLETVLREAGFSLSDVVRLNYYTTDVDLFFASARGAGRRLAAANCRPASTLLGVTRLASPEFMIEIEATAEA
jgi:enamine deaminase RidA (YjgF/YER057c/UK114 family)